MYLLSGSWLAFHAAAILPNVSECAHWRLLWRLLLDYLHFPLHVCSLLCIPGYCSCLLLSFRIWSWVDSWISWIPTLAWLTICSGSDHRHDPNHVYVFCLLLIHLLLVSINCFSLNAYSVCAWFLGSLKLPLNFKHLLLLIWHIHIILSEAFLLLWVYIVTIASDTFPLLPIFFLVSLFSLASTFWPLTITNTSDTTMLFFQYQVRVTVFF